MSDSPSPPLSANERQAIASFLDQLSRRYPKPILQSVLFGSKARGDSAPWSDIDILIIVDDEDWRFQHAISTVAARVSLEYDVLIAPRLVGHERWERMKRHGFGLYQNIIDERIPLSPTPAPS